MRKANEAGKDWGESPPNVRDYQVDIRATKDGTAQEKVCYGAGGIKEEFVHRKGVLRG